MWKRRSYNLRRPECRNRASPHYTNTLYTLAPAPTLRFQSRSIENSEFPKSLSPSLFLSRDSSNSFEICRCAAEKPRTFDGLSQGWRDHRVYLLIDSVVSRTDCGGLVRGRFAYDNNGDGEKDILARGIRARPWPDIGTVSISKSTVKSSAWKIRAEVSDVMPAMIVHGSSLRPPIWTAAAMGESQTNYGTSTLLLLLYCKTPRRAVYDAIHTANTAIADR